MPQLKVLRGDIYSMFPGPVGEMLFHHCLAHMFHIHRCMILLDLLRQAPWEAVDNLWPFPDRAKAKKAWNEALAYMRGLEDFRPATDGRIREKVAHKEKMRCWRVLLGVA